jgi:hypothetical protein
MKISVVTFLFFVTIMFTFSQSGLSEGVKKYGVVHNIAEDRIFENIGGLHEPEGLDKYMKRHFDSLQLKINELSGEIRALTMQVNDVKKKLDVILVRS